MLLALNTKYTYNISRRRHPAHRATEAFVNYCGYDLKYVLNKTFPQYKFDIIHVHVAIGNMEVLTLINLKVRCSFEMMYFLLFCSFVIEDGKYLAEQGKGKKSV